MSANPINRRPALAITPQPALRSITIEWGVSRRGVGQIAPKGTASLLTLRYQAGPGQREQWSLLDPVSGASSALPARINEMSSTSDVRISGDCVHIQSPMLYAFVSIAHDEPELLYARTPIFEHLRIAGGRYQPRGVSVVFKHE